MPIDTPATRASLQHRLRRAWLQVHLWLGVCLAAPLIILGLSGTALVFSQELGRALAPQRYEVSGRPAALPISVYLAAGARALNGKAQASEVRLPYTPRDPVTVTGRQRSPNSAAGYGGRGSPSLTVWIEPKDARVLDVADPRGGPVSFIHRLHGALAIASKPGLGPGVGRLVVGWLGLVLAISSLTGLWLWWPRGPFSWPKLGGALAWRRTPATLDNLHHLVGFWSCLPLLILSLTGMYIAFPQQSHALFGAPPPAPRQDINGALAAKGRPVERAADQNSEYTGVKGGHAYAGLKSGGFDRLGAGTQALAPVTVDQAVAAALLKNPGASLQVVTLPGRRQGAYKVEFADQRPAVSVDAISAAVTLAPPEAQRVVDPISGWMRQTHEGLGYGTTWKWIAAFTGLAPTLLGVTGVCIWWTKRERRKAIAKTA